MRLSSRLYAFLTDRAPVDRRAYAAAGILLFLLKYLVDWGVAAAIFNRPWSIANYLPQVQAELVLRAVEGHRFTWFESTMLSLSLPFIAVGVCLTLGRLGDARLPLWFVFLFFVPVVNLCLFLCLCLLPSRQPAPAQQADAAGASSMSLGRVIPPAPAGSAASAIALTGVLGALLATLDVYALGVYGLGLFIGLPFSLGMMAALIHGVHGVRSRRQCIGVALGGTLTTLLVLLFAGFEGVLCLAMAAPLTLGCACLGGVAGYAIQAQARDQRDAALLITGLSLLVPAIMGAESAAAPVPPLYIVRSAVDIDADPADVWPHVITFPDLPPPTEWVFQTGVAYPTRATITGRGVGAERRCHFSTGVFVEPIEVWDEPRLLRFAVTENPAPMNEWTLFAGVHPPHLDGLFVSSAGQFLLTRVPGGGTRLEGSTWYHHGMWPAAYWRLWSDWIIHRIHLRVLNHIQRNCEDQ